MMPEMYWIKLGAEVIGADVLRDGQNARQAATYRTIADWINKRDIREVFDVGCNVAALAVFLNQSGCAGQYSGIDANPHAVDYARRTLGASVEVGSIRALALPDRLCECVVVKDVIEHLEGPELLAEAFRVSRQYVVVATYIPWTNQPAEIVRNPDGYFTNRYDYREVVRLASGWGFDLSEMDSPLEANGTLNQVWYFERQAVQP